MSLGHDRFGSEDPLLFPPLGVLDVLGLFLHLLVLHVDSQSTKVRLELALLLELCDDGMSASGFTHDDDLGKLVSIEQSPEERYQSLGILTLVDLDDERRRVGRVVGHGPQDIPVMRIPHSTDDDDREEGKDILGELSHVITGRLDLGVVKLQDEF